MDLIAIATEFGTPGACFDFLEKMRWPEGVRCLKCDADKVSKIVTKESVRKNGRKIPARHLYQCLACDHQFTPTTGTLFNDTHLPIQKWFFAVALMTNAKKGLSAKQMQRDLKVSYQTAWYLCHRIREAHARRRITVYGHGGKWMRPTSAAGTMSGANARSTIRPR
jgi:transposase-like protein